MWAAGVQFNRLRQMALIARLAGAAIIGLLNVFPILAQSSPLAPGPLPVFEVASVKPCRSMENSGWHIQRNRLTVRNMVTEMIIDIAYGHDFGEFGFRLLRHDELVGGPSWIRGERFAYEGYDIDAKVDDSVVEKFGKDCGDAFYRGSCGYRQQFLLMFQSLLADRFKLKVRREAKEGPIYALVVAKGGPKFLHTRFEVPDYTAIAQNSTLPPPQRPPCPAGMSCVQDYTSMGLMADWLSGMPQFDRPVIDRTGLQGGYYIKLQWVRAQPASAYPGMDIAPPLGPSGPVLFTALQQQLGLKLVPTKGPVDVLVIDHIEKPSEN
jgi:uncharacterized protein (TIGR03435 family)